MTITKWKHKDTNKPEVPQIFVMAPPRSSISSLKSPRSPRDTGFPEPFNGVRNTTLPHPDADTSPGACINPSDVSVELIKSRRHSLLMKHRRTISSGKINPLDSITMAAPEVESEKRPQTNHSDQVVEAPQTPSTANRGSESFDRARVQDSPNTSFEDDDGANKRRSIFGKWKKG